MPRAKKTTTAKKRAPRKKARRGERRTQIDRRSDAGDAFWKKVVDGFKKLLSSPFK